MQHEDSAEDQGRPGQLDGAHPLAEEEVRGDGGEHGLRRDYEIGDARGQHAEAHEVEAEAYYRGDRREEEEGEPALPGRAEPEQVG